MGKYIYAFDLSMSCTGLVIFDNMANPIFVGNIKTNKKDSHSQRLKQIADFVLELRKQYETNIIVIERGFERFATSTQVLFRVHGIINYLFHDCIQIYYSPKEIKSKLLNGNATKKQIHNIIKTKYPYVKFSEIKKNKKEKEENNDESDAFAVGLTYFINKNIISWNKE